MQWWTLKQLKSKSARARLSGLEKLGQEGDAGLVGSVIPLLGDPESFVRVAAADALGRIRSEEAISALAANLPKDPEPEPRRAMAKAMQSIGSKKAVPALVEALGDPSGEVGWQAAQALKSLSWEPGNDTEHAAWHLAVSHFDIALSFGAAAVEPLIKLAHGTSFHRCIRAVEALAIVGGAQVVKPLLEVLGHSDFTVRSAAATALGQLGDARAIDPLVQLLNDPHHQVCLAACLSLSKVGDQRAVEPLIRVVNHAAPDVRAAAVEALGKLRDARAVQPLVGLLQDAETDVRETAAAALGAIGDEDAIQHLVLGLTDLQSSVRQAAAGALRRIQPYWERSEAALQAIPGLQAALKSKDYWVRHSAADILKKLGVSQSDDTTLRTDTDGARQKRHAAHAILVAMLGDHDREFRQAAAEAMGRVGLSDSIPQLVERLSDADRGVQTAAARSLEKLRWQPDRVDDKARQFVALERWADAAALGTGAVEAIAGTISWNDALARRRAIEALVHIGDRKAITALKEIAANSSAAIRDEAGAALAVLERDKSARKEPAEAWSKAN